MLSSVEINQESHKRRRWSTGMIFAAILLVVYFLLIL